MSKTLVDSSFIRILEGGHTDQLRRAPYWILKGEFGKATVSVQNRSLVSHAHSEFNVLFKLGGEDSTLRTSDGTLKLSDDSIIFFNPWESHSVQKSDRGLALHLVLEISQDWLASLLCVHVDTIQKLFPSPLGKMTPEIRAQSARMAAVVCRGLTMTKAKCNDAISELMTLLVHSQAQGTLTGPYPMPNRIVDRRIRKAVQHIRARASENPNLDEIASGVGLSRSHFFQQFKLCVGVSPQHFLDWQRMALAIEALCGSDLAVAEISHNLGFSAPAHFTRFFVQHIGLSPSEYRRFSIEL